MRLNTHYLRSIQLLILAMFVFTGCTNNDDNDKPFKPSLPDSNICILYDNDVHGMLEGYVKMAALKTECMEKTRYVTTVSSGDFSIGSAPVGMTKGMAAYHVMNKVSYDITTLGNHEFDFGIDYLMNVTRDSLHASIVSSNLCRLPSGELLFPAYKIMEYGKTKVGFIGITTPNAAETDSPTSFIDENGNPIYGFKPETFVERMQQTVDEVRTKGADYVVVLSHLGDDANADGTYKNLNSCMLINNTTGINVVLDGHTHIVMPDSMLFNKAGERVLLTQTGTKFQNIGLLTLDTLGQFASRLIALDTYTKEDAAMKAFVEEEIEKASGEGKRVVGHTDVDIPDTDSNGKRAVRNQESPIGDLVTDAFRNTFNTDIAFINGGGVRSGIKAGDITFNSIYEVLSFGDELCTATIKGKDLADALEYTGRLAPEENGSFLQISSIRYDFDETVKADYLLDEATGLFIGIRDGAPRRVTNIQIFNKTTNKFEPLDPEREYTVTTSDYMVNGTFENGVLHCMKDITKVGAIGYDVLSDYIENTLHGVVPSKYANTDGRINIIRY